VNRQVLTLQLFKLKLPHLHARQLAQHVALAHLLEHLSHLRVLAKKIIHFLHSPS